MRGACYWHYPTGAATRNATTRVIRVPRDQLFTPESLKGKQEWEFYLTRYQALDRRLRGCSWFGAEGWDTQFRFIPPEDSPRVIFLLYKTRWGVDVHFKTRLTNLDLQKRTARVGLHIEANVPTHGFSRTAFNKLFQERLAEADTSLPDYTAKPRHDQKPLHTVVAFTDETLVDVLKAEFETVRLLGLAIDSVLEKLHRPAASR